MKKIYCLTFLLLFSACSSETQRIAIMGTWLAEEKNGRVQVWEFYSHGYCLSYETNMSRLDEFLKSTGSNYPQTEQFNLGKWMIRGNQINVNCKNIWRNGEIQPVCIDAVLEVNWINQDEIILTFDNVQYRCIRKLFGPQEIEQFKHLF